MDPENTKPAWASRTNQLIIIGMLAGWLTRAYGISIPVEAHGLVVDLVGGVLGVDGGLEPAVVLHAVAEGVADDGDAVAGVEAEASAAGGGGRVES